MKKLLFVTVLIIAVSSITVMPFNQAQASVSACDLALWCGWCPAYAFGCIWEIIYSYTGGDAPEIEPSEAGPTIIVAPSDADGLSG